MLDALPKSVYTEAIKKLPRLFGGAEVFAEAEQFCKGHPVLSETLDYMRTLYTALSSLGLDDRLMVDFGLVQRNDYYTGVVFSAYVENYGDAVLMGGRYDTLLKQFDAPMPAIGFAATSMRWLLFCSTTAGLKACPRRTCSSTRKAARRSKHR